MTILKQASRGFLHKAAISGLYETIKMLLESGEDVDQRDQVLVFSLVYFNLVLISHLNFEH